jgi:hypothetical protein
VADPLAARVRESAGAASAATSAEPTRAALGELGNAPRPSPELPGGVPSAADVGNAAADATRAGQSVGSRIGNFLTGEGSEEGSIDPRLAMRLGGAAAGVASQETGPTSMTEQEKQDPWGRFSRDISAGILGSAAPGVVGALARGGGTNYADLARLRPSAPAPKPGGPQTGPQIISAFTKNNLLSGPKTHITNILTQLAELAQHPISQLASGHEDDAIAGLKAAGQSVPDAMRNFATTMRTGQTQMTQATGKTPAHLPFLRLLGATDDFFKTIGWAMGAGEEGQRVLREAGATGSTASAILSANVPRINAAGEKMGNMSVFTAGKDGIGGQFSRWKNGLLNSPSKMDQTKGMLIDALVPFANIPDRIWNIGLKRLPGVNELNTIAQAGIAFKKGDPYAARQALGEGLVNSVINMSILSNIANGNIRGPDDPEHPSGIKIRGQWMDYSNWGPWATPIAVPAAIYEAARKEGNKPNPDVVTAAANASAKALSNQVFAADLFKTMSQIGQGNLSGAAGSLAGGYVDRYLPAAGAMNQATAMFDPILRDPSSGPLVNWAQKNAPGIPGIQGLGTVLGREQAKIPGLEGQLAPMPVMTSGQPQQRQSSGAGEFFGAQTRPVSPLYQQIAELERKNFSISDPTKLPTSVSLGGANIPLTDDEQRQLAVTRGQLIDQAMAAQMRSAGWNSMSDQQKAITLNAVMSSLDAQNAALFVQMTPPAELQRRIEQGRRVAGQLQPVGSR